MRTFSKWNYATRQYDYYSAGDFAGTHVTQPPSHFLQGSQIGMTPDEFGTQLPSGAQKVGSGDVAKGQVAATGVRSGLVPTWVMYGVIAYLAWRVLR